MKPLGHNKWSVRDPQVLNLKSNRFEEPLQVGRRGLEGKRERNTSLTCSVHS